MGISGLLPLLKSIQVNKHFTLAVDAYVWLHRGVIACATEVATGKKTTKYVDYVMHRVRLLRHHNIQPYVVLDGGPLPAKKRTESERKQRREENLAKANALAAQGKHSQARDFYVKCVDVTPQMAYQLIKALRTEGVQHVVAPYEADAQMAYLERIGLVDGIVTEDSDLLVFGCRKVLFKLDSVSSAITSISRDDFGSVAAAEGGISLLGWTDSQFRAMAILSGCDYLASIPGVGLKTAWTLLRKYRTVDQLVRALRLEGKKPVPKGYLEAYHLAEKVFLHQRVYCPLEEKLVSLTEIPVEDMMDAETEAYIGR
ncbi:PIN domain-like protein [Melanogaster broomeanus]|nr:PIN domain-like protein [Melanogaster broomeanus]